MQKTDPALEKLVSEWNEENIDKGGLVFPNRTEVWLRTALTSYAEKKVIEERQRIEDVFKQYVPPHPFDLEDGVWMQRLLNKAFSHTQESKEIKQ